MGRDALGAAGVLVWLCAVGAGCWVWDRSASAPGELGTTPTTEPAPRTGSWELQLFAHPHCPCTRPAFGALRELADEFPDLKVRIAFVRPPGARAGWEHSTSWEGAEAVPGARVYCDANGEEARRAGAIASGTAILTDPTGRVAFRGGLTPRGGHGTVGPGLRAARAWLSGGTGADRAPVFGCLLFDDTD